MSTSTLSTNTTTTTATTTTTTISTLLKEFADIGDVVSRNVHNDGTTRSLDIGEGSGSGGGDGGGNVKMQRTIDRVRAIINELER